MSIKMNLLRKEEERIVAKWRSFIDRLPEAACLVSENHLILYANSHFNKLYTPYSEKDVFRFDDLFITPAMDPSHSNSDRRIFNVMSVHQKAMVEMDQTLVTEDNFSFRLSLIKDYHQAEKNQVSPFHEKILDHLFQEIVVVNRAFNFVYFSAATLKDVNLRDWLIGRSDYDYCKKRGVDKVVADRRFEQYRKAFDTRQVVTWTEEFPLSDGGVKKMYRKISPILDDQGEVEYLLINSFYDSDKHLLGHEYEVSKQRFDAMVENAHDAIVLFDGNNQFCVDANHAATKLFGRNKVEMLKSSFSDFSFQLQPKIDDTEVFIRAQFAQAAKHNTATFNWIVENTEGQLTPTEVRLIRLPSSKRVLIRASFSDISERLIAEQSQKQYQLLFENSQQGILVYNVTKNKIVSCNNMACKIYGFSKEELMDLKFGHHSPKLQSNGQHSGALIKKYTHEIFKNGTAQIEVEQLTKEGKVVNLAVMGYKLKSNEDELMVSVFIDRTEHITNREKLKKQADQFKQFVENTPSAVAMLDTNMNYILVSEEWRKSYAKGGEDLIGKNHYDLHPEIPQRWKRGHQDALRGKRVKKNKDALIIDGKTEWFRWEVRPWHTFQNEIGGILIYSECITEQVEAESKIRRQGVQFKSVFESSSIGWLECDVANAKKYIERLKKKGVTYIDEHSLESEAKELWPHFKVLNYNKQIREIFGMSEKGRLTELKILSMMKEDAKQIFLGELEAMLNNEKSFETEFRITNLHGEERHLYLSVNYPEDDDYSRVLYSVLDITDLRQSVKALRQSEQRYKSMFEDNRLAVAYTNEEEDYFKVNQAFLNMFGYSQQELNKIKHEDFALPEYVEETKENYRKLKRSHIRSFNMEKEYLTKEGKVLHANLSVTGLYDFSGHYFGNVAIIENITEKKEIYAKLNQQNNELKNINKELDRFVYSAAHDLRAPLANVKGLANLIKLEDLSEDATTYLDMQLKSIEKLDTFIKSLVDFLKNSRHELQIESIDFEGLVPNLIDQYRFGENSQDINFTYVVEQKNNFVTDPRRLEIVMSNLLSNSIRYSDPNKDRSIDMKVSVDEDGAEIIIRDNGIGIVENELEKIFKLFYRSSESSEGTGIGLYLVKETVEKLQGEIKVNSEHGQWTEFTVKLNSLKENN